MGLQLGGLAAKLEPQVEEKIKGSEVVIKENATNPSYTESIIIDLTGKRKDDVQNFASILSLEVGNLAQGEIKPDADFLIIIGKDIAK